MSQKKYYCNSNNIFCEFSHQINTSTNIFKTIQEFDKLLNAYYTNELFTGPHNFINTTLVFLPNSFYLIPSTLCIKNMMKI